MLYFLYTSKHCDHDNNERGLLLQINHFYSHLHILPAERAVATLNNVDKRVNLAVVMKLMEGKTFSMMHEVKEETRETSMGRLYLLKTAVFQISI